MQNGITVSLNQLLFSVSFALDVIEGEVIGAVKNHSKRVAYLALLIAKKQGMCTEDLIDLASCSVLHDNALTEYVCNQHQQGKALKNQSSLERLDFHCIKGEENVEGFPFCKDRKGVIAYHHENADGSGLLHVKAEDTPFMSRIIRLCDQVDVKFRLSSYDSKKLEKIKAYVTENKGILYDPVVADIFLDLLTDESMAKLDNSCIEENLLKLTPEHIIEMSYEAVIKFCSVFAKIIDCKSKFTLTHSSGIAEKTLAMAKYYKLDVDTLNQLYIAAFLHDIGKLTTPLEILEKPGKLTFDEYEIMKQHVYYTYEILSAVKGFEQISVWASSHHEKLDGTGYFRGEAGKYLDFPSRILCCIDIYQALVESRPYRVNMPHEKAMEILSDMAENGKLDKTIVADVDKVFSTSYAI